MTQDLPGLRRVRDEEWRDFGHAIATNFHDSATDAEVDARRSFVDLDRFVTATDADGRHVATAGAVTFELAVPGGARVGCAGVTAVTVRTDHRRRGLLRAMLTRLHADARERGEPVAALYASEAPIYGRFGYGVAVPMQDVQIDRRHLTTGGDATRVRLVTRDRYLEVAPRVQAAIGDRRGGILTLPDGHWQFRTSDDWPADQSPHQFAVVGVDGAERGILRYRTTGGKWADRVPDDRIEVDDLMGVDREAEADLWAHLAGADLVADVSVEKRPLDDPLRWSLVDETRLRARSAWPMYVAVLDVPAALAARTYDTSDRLVLEVIGPDDAVARWSLDASPEGVEVAATDDPVDVRLGAPDLASLWLGGVSPFPLADAGRVVATDPVLRRLRRLFAVDRLPWCPMMF